MTRKVTIDLDDQKLVEAMVRLMDAAQAVIDCENIGLQSTAAGDVLDELDEALTSLAAHVTPQEDGWRSIESAPKDGARVL